MLERSIVLGSGAVLTVDDLPEELHERAPLPATPGPPAALSYHAAVTAAKRAILREALRAEGSHQTRAAKRLGLTQPYLARLMKNLRVKSGEDPAE